MFLLALTIGATVLAGFLVALFGAWKDTLWEQFSPRKFLRTPIVTVIAGIFLVLLLGSPSDFSKVTFYVLSAVALERLATESHKAVHREMPSKFLRPQRDRGWLRDRFTQMGKQRNKVG